LVRPLDQSAARHLPAVTRRRYSGTTDPRRKEMRDSIRALRRGLMVLGLAVSGAAFAQAPITLHGASQFNDDHAFTKAMVKFEELVKKYYGKPVNFVLHKNSELGLEKDYFAYMNQGVSVDYAIVSPAHMSTFSKAAPFIDAPFLFRDLDHWN
jgi:TRAP-type C4-dicarboxylate transport system substrate-binding protein